MAFSPTRIDSNIFVRECFTILSHKGAIIFGKNILYCGVAGNPSGVIGDYSGPIPDLPECYAGHNLKTFDVDPCWNPSFVADITDIDTMPPEIHGEIDLIVVTQVIEHVKNINKIPETINILLKRGGHAIIDCPWGPRSPDYHGEPPSFGDYWRISDEGLRLIFGTVSGFNVIHSQRTPANSGILIEKTK